MSVSLTLSIFATDGKSILIGWLSPALLTAGCTRPHFFFSHFLVAQLNKRDSMTHSYVSLTVCGCHGAALKVGGAEMTSLACKRREDGQAGRI